MKYIIGQLFVPYQQRNFFYISNAITCLIKMIVLYKMSSETFSTITSDIVKIYIVKW